MLLGDRSKGLLYVLIEVMKPTEPEMNLISLIVINLYPKGEDIKEEGGENWNTFDELLRQRQSGKRLTNDAFRQFVSQESQILRQNIDLSSM